MNGPARAARKAWFVRAARQIMAAQGEKEDAVCLRKKHAFLRGFSIIASCGRFVTG